MADKKCTIYIIDVGPTMWQKQRKFGGTGLDLAKKAVLTMLEAKVIAGLKSDVTSLIIVGSDETKNYMNDESGGYENISVLYPIEQPKLPILRTIDELSQGNFHADVFDALILALGMITAHCRNLKYKKNIYLLTDGESDINKADFNTVVQQINSSNIELNILGVDFNDEELGFVEENKSKIKEENEKFFHDLTKSCQQATVFSMEETLRQLSKPYIRPVRPTPVYKGTLTLGDAENNPQTFLMISIEMYNRTTKAKPTNTKKYSSVAEASANNDKKTFEVNISKSFYVSNLNNEAVEVPLDELNKAYLLGKTYVPVDELNEGIFNLSTKDSMQIICFLKASEFPRKYFMSNVAAILPQKGSSIMAQRLSALIHGLFEKDSYAMVRYVRKSNDAPKLGILIPYISAQKECLYFTRIAFKEDYRKLTFPPLDRVISKCGNNLTNHPYLPTDEMLDKMGKFIENMDIKSIKYQKDSDPKEHLKVKECFNPTIHMTKKVICHRALHPDQPIPPPDPEMIAQTKLLPQLIEKNKELVNELREILKIKQVIKEKGKASKRKFADANRPTAQILSLDELLSTEPQENGKRPRPDNDIISDTLSTISQSEIVREVGTVDPVKNFKIMISNHSKDMITTAVEQMSQVILHFVKTSFGEGLYKKAIECMVVLRQTCAQEDESTRFNDFLKGLKSLCFDSQPPKINFWEMVVKERITLISSEEANSATSSQEAEEFLQEAPDKKTNISIMNEDEVATDDLFDLMDD
ncbi:11094_t:CDS:10 [Diversispora eburnea]|uniref:ATP-dependent DNA helicase II subunit 2 n=1 Tax=Diversispora eburnea TaxID=1213867 RepID=A0A9N8Z156_9GLOM|nr:11094_t:CDS:10 [Diversispora eburnea]